MCVVLLVNKNDFMLKFGYGMMSRLGHAIEQKRCFFFLTKFQQKGMKLKHYKIKKEVRKVDLTSNLINNSEDI